MTLYTCPEFTIYKDDFFKGLSDAESVDLVVTDPPYESLEKHRRVGTTTRLKVSKGSSNPWFDVISNSMLPDMMARLYRVLKPNTHCYVFCDQETMFTLVPAGVAAGFKFWKPIIWDKLALGMGYHYRCRYECILFFEKGKRKLNFLGVPDVLRVNRIRNGYPTEKPSDVASVLIAQSTPDFSSAGPATVFDPFMGSGSTGHAAVTMGRRFVGCDKAHTSFDHTHKRLTEALAVHTNGRPFVKGVDAVYRITNTNPGPEDPIGPEPEAECA